MSQVILIGEDSKFKLSETAKAFLESQAEVKTVTANEIVDKLNSEHGESVRLALLEFSEAYKNVATDLAKEPNTLMKIVWVVNDESPTTLPEGIGSYSRIHERDLDQELIANALLNSFLPERSVGVKSFLKPGSTIFSESFIGLQGLGAKLDPCNMLAAQNLPKKVAAVFWSTVNSLVTEAITLLPASMVDAKRVELQIGTDDNLVCASIRFPFDFKDSLHLNEYFTYEENKAVSQWLLARENANLIELRAYEENKSVELIAVFIRNEMEQSVRHPVLIRHMHEMPLEDASQVSQYKFKMFSSIALSKKKGQIGFRKKHSDDQAKQIISGRAEEDDNTETRIKGEAPEKEVKTKVEGVTDHIQEEKITVKDKSASNKDIVSISDIRKIEDADKKASLYESKIQGLQETLEQREGLITKLNKEIEEINDPMKRGAISGVIDNQQKALMQNVKRLESELQEADKREKELMSMVDKAVQQKDSALKSNKALEAKLAKASQGNNAQTVQLKKQLEEANKQKAILSKKLADALGGNKKAS